jgi:hypothetical protein
MEALMSSAELLRTFDGLGRPKIVLLGDRGADRSPCAYSLLCALEAEVTGQPASATAGGEDGRIARLEELMPWHDALVIRDQAAACPLRVLRGAIHAANLVQLPSIVYPSVTRRLDDYRGATALHFGGIEAEAATAHAIKHPADALAAGRALCHRLEVPLVFLTLEHSGVVVVEQAGFGEFFPTHGARSDEETAGEISLALIALGLAEHATPADTAHLASLAAEFHAEHPSEPLTRAALRDKILAPQGAIFALPEPPLRRAG